MPVLVTFDFSQPKPAELDRIRSAFERLGWERVGNTAYRYPHLGAHPETEDWLNRVVPALMLLRALARSVAENKRSLLRYTIDAQSSTGYNAERTAAGTPPLAADEIDLAPTTNRKFGLQNLRDWIDGIAWPYAEEEEEADAP